PSLFFVAITLLLITLVVIGLTFVHKNDPLTSQLLLLLLFYVYGYISVQLVSSKLQLEERYALLTLWQMLPNSSRLLIIVIGYYVLEIQLSIINIGWIYALVGFFFTSIAAVQLVDLMRGKFRLIGHTNTFQENQESPAVKEVFKEAWPFGFAGLFAFIYIQSDIIMVKYISGDTEAGYYNVAFTILSAIMTIPTILFSKYLIPKYHRWSNHDKDRFYSTYKKGNLAMLVSGSCILAGVILLSWYFIPLLFGKEYEPSIILLNVLAVTIPFSFLAYSYGATLLTSEHMRLKVRLMGGVALFNVISNLIFIIWHGAIGAAVSTLLSYILLAFLYRYYARKKVFQ
ncbi:MAG: oligosaccharide flippase family protein, partial [Chitinophagaceae bacterium]